MSVNIKNLEIGAGKTKICVPVIGRTDEEILSQAMELKYSVADIIEWRVDFFDDVMDCDKVLKMTDKIVDVLGDKPVLFTFRSKKEGGEKCIDTVNYKKLLKTVIRHNKVGAVDVEAFMEEGLLEEISKAAADYDVKIIASNHDFDGTPEKDEIVRRLMAMKEMGAHICKIAVMPKNPQDVLTLLTATTEVKNKDRDMTIITMSMGQLGVISRVSGKIFGSAMTFGARTKEQASAPGQLMMNELKNILDSIE